MDKVQFNKAINTIKKSTNMLADMIHIAGMFAIQQANEFNNITYGLQLIEALGKKHDVARVEKWLLAFGKFGMKKDKLVYLDRRDIKPENLEAILEKANATPWYDYTPVSHAKFTVDYMAILQSAMQKHEKAEKLAAEGKEVEVKNAAVFPLLEELFAKLQIKKEEQSEAVAA